MALLQYKWWLTLLLLPFNLQMGPSRPNALPAPHPFYASVTEINHNAKDKTLEISCKVFADDFEKILEKLHNTALDIYKPRDKAQLEGFMHDYLQKHLKIKLDGKAVQLEYLGHELEDQSAWLYLQVSNVAPPKKIEINNDIFYETYDSEINIMHVSVAGIRKSTKLDYPATQAVFEF